MLCHKTQLQTLLSRHIGRGNGVTAQAVADLIEVPPRQVRHLVTELRLDGVAVCGTPRDGYYIAASGEELEATCHSFCARAPCTAWCSNRACGACRCPTSSAN